MSKVWKFSTHHFDYMKRLFNLYHFNFFILILIAPPSYLTVLIVVVGYEWVIPLLPRSWSTPKNGLKDTVLVKKGCEEVTRPSLDTWSSPLWSVAKVSCSIVNAHEGGKDRCYHLCPCSCKDNKSYSIASLIKCSSSHYILLLCGTNEGGRRSVGVQGMDWGW